MESLLYLFAGIPFYIADSILTSARIQSPYYILHALHNWIVVYLTYEDVIRTFTEFHSLQTYSVNYSVPALVTSFHLYHILKYKHKMRRDDWIHHILMIGVAIPLGLYVTSQTTLMSYSLFWATGFPGGISYISLFMNRNFLISQMTEKAINTWINVWIRAPGCISLAVLTLVYVSSNEKGNVIGLLPGLLMYWNGQYFMQQTVMDYAIRSVKHTEEEV